MVLGVFGNTAADAPSSSGELLGVGTDVGTFGGIPTMTLLNSSAFTMVPPWFHQAPLVSTCGTIGT